MSATLPAPTVSGAGPATADPASLIPGYPAGIQEIVLALDKYSELLVEAGRGLARIDTSDGWSGPAADAFRAIWHGQPKRWLIAGDAFEAAATALDGYLSTLAWAQQQAVTASAQAEAGQHAAAAHALATARTALEEAAHTASSAINAAAGDAPPKPSFWSRAGHWIGHTSSTLGHGIEDLGDTFVNDLASAGNAGIRHPGDLFDVVGGASLATASIGGEGLGGFLDFTGIGAVVGIPLGVVSAGGATTGIAWAATGVGAIAAEATGPDHLTLMGRKKPAPGDEDPQPRRGGTRRSTTPSQDTEQAKKLGYGRRIPPQRVPGGASHGQPVYGNGKSYITPDTDGHNVTDGWKTLNRRLQRTGTWTWDLTTRVKD